MISSSVSRRDPLLGKTLLGRYDIVGRMGSGSVSDVYLARQSSVGNRNVAVKTLKRVLCASNSSEAAVHSARFRREAELLSLLRSSCFVRVFEVGVLEDEGVKRPFMVMEYLGGVVLGEQLKAGEALGLETALEHWLLLADGLIELHRFKVVYRDLSPGNVILEECGPRGIMPVLFDFSHATMVGIDGMDGAGEAGHILAGTPLYTAPEMSAGQGDERSDVFSLGALLYAMITARPPLSLRGSTWDDYLAAVSRGRKMPERSLRSFGVQAPRGLEQAIARSLSTSPDDRFSSVSELADAVCRSVVRSSELMGTNGVSGGLLTRLVGWVLGK